MEREHQDIEFDLNRLDKLSSGYG